MVILHILAHPATGGLEQVVQALAVGQAASGHDVHVVAVVPPGEAEHPFLQMLGTMGVHTHAVPVANRAYFQERSRVGAICRELRPGVVHTHGYRPDVVDSGVARTLGFPVVATAHGYTGGGWRNRLYERLQRMAFRHFNAVVAVSQPLLRQLKRSGVSPDRIHLIPNAWAATTLPIDREAARQELQVPRDTFHLGWVGRLSREKGLDVLVDALVGLQDLQFVASVIGEGPERGATERRVSRLGLADRMRWRGVVPRAGRVFSAFDVFVLSSRTEGVPIVLFEAMATGTPIVATKVGGVPDALSPREALLVPPNDPAALADAIRQVFRDPDGAAVRARAARARLASDFGVEPWLAQYEAVYHAARASAARPV